MPYYPEKQPGPVVHAQERKTKAKQKLSRALFAALSLLLIGYGLFRLIGYGTELAASRDTSNELQEIYMEADTATEKPIVSKKTDVIPVSTQVPTEDDAKAEEQETLKPVPYPGNPDLRVSERFLKLRRKGIYIVGWLSMDGVEEAIAQKDNNFFLKHDATGKRNGNGAIFLDMDISLMTRPYTIILYGHNMKSGNMFGRLKKYQENTYFNKHRIITFDSMYEDGQYAVFAVLKISTQPGTALWYDLWSLNTKNRTDRKTAIRTLEKRSVQTSVLDVQADDQLLLLVTCLDGEDERLIVVARRLREGETPDQLILR